MGELEYLNDKKGDMWKMEREEAIKELTEIAEYYDAFGPTIPGSAIREAIDVLCAKQTPLDRSRWEGCEWCYDEIPFDSEDMELELQHPLEDKLRMVYPKFCPMCGRPLTEEAWAEMERRINGGKTD